MKKKELWKPNRFYKKITFKEQNYKYNTPTKIMYENWILIINTNNYYDKVEATWKCQYYKRTKDKPKNKTRFCDATIKGLRNIFNNQNLNFILNIIIQ